MAILAEQQTQLLHEKIREDIILGSLKAGDKLKPAELKSTYSTSINTVREALSRLSAEGFVIAIDQKGFRVSDCSLNNLNELREMRLLLELEGINKSIDNNNIEWEARVVSAHYKLDQIEKLMEDDQDENFLTWCEYDYQFHEALISNCQSQLLIKMHKQVFRKFRRYFFLNIKENGFQKEAISEDHANLSRSVLTGDKEKVRGHLLHHMDVLVSLEHWRKLES